MSEVPPQGSYTSKRCPQRLQLDVLHPCEPLPASAFISMLADEGKNFESDIFERLAAGTPGAVVIDGSLSRSEREAATIAAMDNRLPLVIGGRLPVDRMALRAGEPDLLVRSDAIPHGAAEDGYLPVDIKHHKTVDVTTEEDEDGVLISELDMLFTGSTEFDPSIEARWLRPDLLQLAHYQRLLESCGRDSRPGRWGGIVGREERLVWYDLDLPHWNPSEYIEDPPEHLLSTMEVYDVEFAYRLSVIDASLVHVEDPTSPLLAEPIAVKECDGCGWQDWCFTQMEESGDLSLLPGITVAKRRKYHARGVTTLRELASLDSASARLIAAGVDLAYLEERARTANSSTPVTELLASRPKQAERLVEERIETVADLGRLDPVTARFGDAGLSDLPQQLDNARARIGPSPAYRRRGVHQVVVPRADVEVDVDMESVNEGCYLWGTLLNVRGDAGPESSTFVPFSSWNPDIAVGELEAFLSFWEWFSDLRREAARRGVTFLAYCYHQGAENGQLRRLSALCGLEEDVDDFIRSEQWVDLLPIVKNQLITGLQSYGLKTVAPLTGFSWREEDVGGVLAMVRYFEATADGDAEMRAAAQQWILEYNEDDVHATAALRDWLDQCASLLPSIEEAAPVRPPAAG